MIIITPSNKSYFVESGKCAVDDPTIKIVVGRSAQSYDSDQLQNMIYLLNKAKKELEGGYNAVSHTRRENSDGEI